MEKKYYIPFIYAGLIILLALTDALFFRGKKSKSKIIEELTHVIFITIPILYPNIEWRFISQLLLTYLFLRIALFDPLFNLFSNLDINYIGSTDIWNKAIKTLNLKSFNFWLIRIFFIGLTAFIWILHKD